MFSPGWRLLGDLPAFKEPQPDHNGGAAQGTGAGNIAINISLKIYCSIFEDELDLLNPGDGAQRLQAGGAPHLQAGLPWRYDG